MIWKIQAERPHREFWMSGFSRRWQQPQAVMAMRCASSGSEPAQRQRERVEGRITMPAPAVVIAVGAPREDRDGGDGAEIELA